MARTNMMEELQQLLGTVPAEAPAGRYREAVVTENCLGKRSKVTRTLSYRHLAALYALDPEVVLFRALRFLWSRDPAAQPLLALLCAYARDPLLRATSTLIANAETRAEITRDEMEGHIERCYHSRFSHATMASAAQNLLSTWTKSGHLTGIRTKRRSRALATAGSASYALLLAYLRGQRGQSLFESEYARLLDLPTPEVMELAAEASRRGWIVFKRVGEIVEVLFPNLIPPREQEWLREQA